MLEFSYRRLQDVTDRSIEKSVVVVDVTGDVYHTGSAVVEMMLAIGLVDLTLMVVWRGLPGEAGMVVACTNEEDSCAVHSAPTVEVPLLYAMVKQQHSTRPLKPSVAAAAESVERVAILASLFASWAAFNCKTPATRAPMAKRSPMTTKARLSAANQKM